MIIRDADKTDILYLSTVGDEKTIFENSNLCKETITDEIYYDLMQKEKINYNNIHSAADILLCHFAYIYDYNFSTMLKFVDSKGYIDKMYNRFSFEDDITEERYKNIYLHTKTYIKKKQVKPFKTLEKSYSLLYNLSKSCETEEYKLST